ncbi:MAG: hypothetical protein P9X26_10180 [Candidatus Stygibacter frigidus]|nr:hypothetical protein [Candidatus Stygibacter frigidus]
MKKIMLIMVIIIAGLSLYAGRSATPHPVYLELRNIDGTIPAAEHLEITCWLEGKPDQVLDLENCNVIFPIKDAFLQIQCAGFDSWDAGDILHVEIMNTKNKEFLMRAIALDYDNFQIFFAEHLQKQEDVKE